MKAIVYDRYGPPDVLRLAEVRRPVPEPGEVLVRVKATVNRTDTQTRRGVTNTKNIDIVKSLGADLVIDYTQEDFTKNRQSYGVIFDAVRKLSFRACRGSLKPDGIYLPTDHLANVILTLWTARIGDKKVVFAIPPRYTKKDVVFLKGLLEKGKYRAIIDRCHPLDEVIQATRYVETQQKTGNVVLTVDSGQP